MNGRLSPRMELQDLLIACCKSFEATGLSFALAGGFAYGIHVEPRATMDIDFCVVSGHEAEGVSRALHEVFEKVIPHKKPMIFGQVSLYRYVGLRGGSEFVADLLEPHNAAYSESIIDRKNMIGFGEYSIPVISIEDLYILKKLSSRKRDAVDCEMIEESFPSLINDEYIKTWFKKLVRPGE